MLVGWESQVTDYSQIYDETRVKIGLLLDEVKDIFSKPEQEEVSSFLGAREFGLALETLSGILVEEEKQIPRSVLRRIDELASLMHIKDKRFMHDLHSWFDRQHPEAL
jgi:hypothetical protein